MKHNYCNRCNEISKEYCTVNYVCKTCASPVCKKCMFRIMQNDMFNEELCQIDGSREIMSIDGYKSMIKREIIKTYKSMDAYKQRVLIPMGFIDPETCE